MRDIEPGYVLNSSIHTSHPSLPSSLSPLPPSSLPPLPQVSKFSTTILSALMAGMDDREDPQDLITMEAMSGLAKVFEKIEESCVRPILINISLRIRPCFEKVCGVGRGEGECWQD